MGSTGRLLLLVALCVVGGFFAGRAYWSLRESPPPPPLPTAPAAPATAVEVPDVRLPDLSGTTRSLHEWTSDSLVLNFWATWCAPCRAEAPVLQRAAVEYKDKLVIIGVNMTTNDTPAQVPAFVEEFGLTFPIVLDETGEVSQAYQVIGLPTSIFIDQDGIITDVRLGPVDQAYIEAKLAGR